MIYVKADAKHQDKKLIKKRIAGVNFKLRKKAQLYWVHLDHMTDPRTEGYIGVCQDGEMQQRFTEHKSGFKEANFLSPRQIKKLKVVELMSGTYGEMNAQEGVFRPYLGMGWNYLNGGGAVFGMAYLNPSNWVSWFSRTTKSKAKVNAK